MKKEVLLVTILVIIVSLSAVVYAAALTNPGHGVEEVGSGSSPYAPFRDWNALEAGYEDQYSGPAALKSNVFWLATLNAETIAAQNSSGDWCAFQVHPSGIYMNCFNNNSNMSLYNSYYWNGTNFTKNDTIKEGNNVVERNIITAGPNGAEGIIEFINPITGGSTMTTTNPIGSTTTVTNGAGTVFSTTTITPTVIEIKNTDTGEIAKGNFDGGGGVTFGNENGGGTPVGGGLDATPTAGTDLYSYDTAGTNAILSQLTLFENANGGTSTQNIFDIATGIAHVTITQIVDAAGGGNLQTAVISDNANPLTSTTITNFNGADAIYGTQTVITDTGSAATATVWQGITGGSGGEPGIDVSLTDSTGVNTINQNFDPVGGTGAGSIDFTAPTMTETVSGGTIITYLGVAPVGAGDPPVDIAGSDLAHELDFTPGLPTCVKASQTYVPGVGVLITDTDIAAGGLAPCPVPSTATFAFYAVLDD